MGDSESKLDSFEPRTERDKVIEKSRNEKCYQAGRDLVKAIQDPSSSIRKEIDKELDRNPFVSVYPKDVPEYTRLFETLFSCRDVLGMNQTVNGKFEHIRVEGGKKNCDEYSCDGTPGIIVHYDKNGFEGKKWLKFYK